MHTVKVKALVLRNNGRKATLRALDGTDTEIKMYRGTESRADFFKTFPPKATIELEHVETSQGVHDLLQGRAEQGSMTRSEFDSIVRRDVN